MSPVTQQLIMRNYETNIPTTDSNRLMESAVMLDTFVF